MGRSPRIDTKPPIVAGRDHWPQLGFAVVIGGGLQMGQVIGASDDRAGRSRSNPYTPQNMLATLYHVLGIDPKLAFKDHTGRPVPILDEGQAIAELL